MSTTCVKVSRESQYHVCQCQFNQAGDICVCESAKCVRAKCVSRVNTTCVRACVRVPSVFNLKGCSSCARKGICWRVVTPGLIGFVGKSLWLAAVHRSTLPRVIDDKISITTITDLWNLHGIYSYDYAEGVVMILSLSLLASWHRLQESVASKLLEWYLWRKKKSTWEGERKGDWRGREIREEKGTVGRKGCKTVSKGWFGRAEGQGDNKQEGWWGKGGKMKER